VFRLGERPWIQADRDKVERVIEIIDRCPSGALRYTRNGKLGPTRNDPPGIRIRKNGPYEVEGNIPLRTDHWNDGAMHDHYALCRCGASKNKPFCDGSHWKAGFKDDEG
jgi:hypothetical protein